MLISERRLKIKGPVAKDGTDKIRERKILVCAVVLKLSIESRNILGGLLTNLCPGLTSHPGKKSECFVDCIGSGKQLCYIRRQRDSLFYRFLATGTATNNRQLAQVIFRPKPIVPFRYFLLHTFCVPDAWPFLHLLSELPTPFPHKRQSKADLVLICPMRENGVH